MKKILSLLLLLIILSGCKSVKHLNIDSNAFFGSPDVMENIDKYDVYVNDGENIYLLDSVNTGGMKVKGVIKEVKRKEPSGEKKPTNKKQLTLDVVKNPQKDTTAWHVGDKIEIEKNQLKNVNIAAVNEDKIFLVILLVGIGVIIIGLMTFFLVSASSKAANTSAASGSNSGSNSGTSNSGGSNSGNSGSGNSGTSGNSGNSGGSGSNSGSGCYIATMLYGEYDHPKVMVLRNFRDKFLLQTGYGRNFVHWYYTNSPLWVERNKNKKLQNGAIRYFLNLTVCMLRNIGY